MSGKENINNHNQDSELANQSFIEIGPDFQYTKHRVFTGLPVEICLVQELWNRVLEIDRGTQPQLSLSEATSLFKADHADNIVIDPILLTKLQIGHIKREETYGDSFSGLDIVDLTRKINYGSVNNKPLKRVRTKKDGADKSIELPRLLRYETVFQSLDTDGESKVSIRFFNPVCLEPVQQEIDDPRNQNPQIIYTHVRVNAALASHEWINFKELNTFELEWSVNFIGERHQLATYFHPHHPFCNKYETLVIFTIMILLEIGLTQNL